MSSPIKIALADDHALFRGGLARLLAAEPMFDVRIEAPSGSHLLEKLSRQRINVVLTDISMPDMDGLEVTKIITRDYPATRVVAISMHGQAYIIHQMMEAGARAYLLKSAEPPDVVTAVKQVHAGKTYFCGEATAILIDDAARATRLTPKPQLTYREAEVVKLVFREYSDAEIAEQLGLSQKTIFNERKKAMEKLEVKSVVGLTKWVLTHPLP